MGRGSSFGKCLHARMEHFKHSSRWEHSSRKQKMAAINWLKKACHGVKDNAMPFANHGCMDKLDNNYKHMMQSFKKFRQGTHTADEFKNLRAKMAQTWGAINNDCMNKELTKKAPSCKEYLQHHFRNAHILNVDGKSDDEVKKHFSGNFNKLGAMIKNVMDEKFWLNAPKDCGVNHNTGVPHKIKDEHHGPLAWLDMKGEGLKPFDRP